MIEFFVCLIIVLICGGCGFSSSKRKEPTYYEAQKFDDKINELKRNGHKISYSNKNTGTITIRHRDGSTESISVYQGYNSHYKKRTR